MPNFTKIIFFGIIFVLSHNVFGQSRAPAIDPNIVINPSTQEKILVPPPEWGFKNPMNSRSAPPAGVPIGREAKMDWVKNHSPRPTIFNMSHMAILFGILALPLALFFMVRQIFTEKDTSSWSENLTAKVFNLESTDQEASVTDSKDNSDRFKKAG